MPAKGRTVIRFSLLAIAAVFGACSSARQGVTATPTRAQKRGPTPASETTPRAVDTSGAAYVSETISVPADQHDRFVDCLRTVVKGPWAELRDAGVLADVSVFETTVVRSAATRSPRWNFLVLIHLRPGVTPASFFDREQDGPRSRTGGACTMDPGVAVRSIEVLRPTPKSSYPRTTAADDSEAQTGKVRFIIEFIAVNETPAALAEYRESMGQNMGPAMGLMIPEKTYFQLIALETESVRLGPPSEVAWNQLHIRGFYPDKGADPAEMPLALRRVNPSGGREFFARLDKIRTKTREDEARQLYDLALR